jgi:hypothetical protein
VCAASELDADLWAFAQQRFRALIAGRTRILLRNWPDCDAPIAAPSYCQRDAPLQTRALACSMSWRQEHIGLVAIGGAVGWAARITFAIWRRRSTPCPRKRRSRFFAESRWPEIGATCDRASRWRSKPTLFSREPLRRRLQRAAFDFLYPLTYDNEYNLGLSFPIAEKLAATRWAGWVPDFQHRYLPELFSEEEIRRRDTQIAALAAEATAHGV